MRFVPSITSATTSPNTPLVQGVSAAKAVKPIYPPEQPVQYVGHSAAHKEALHPIEPQLQHEMPAEDRRRTCRRVRHQPVLVELRSGVDRRRHNLFVDIGEEHIDLEA